MTGVEIASYRIKFNATCWQSLTHKFILIAQIVPIHHSVVILYHVNCILLLVIELQIIINYSTYHYRADRSVVRIYSRSIRWIVTIKVVSAIAILWLILGVASNANSNILLLILYNLIYFLLLVYLIGLITSITILRELFLHTILNTHTTISYQ